MEFYKIDKPTTRQIFDAIINNDYVPLEKLQPKKNQIKVLLLDHWNCNDILVTFKNVTNSGGFPIFLADDSCLHEIASEDEGFYELSEEDQDHEIELLGCYLQKYDDLF